MTKKDAKQLVKSDLYGAISTLERDGYDYNLKDVIFAVLDNINSATLQKAINKATR